MSAVTPKKHINHLVWVTHGNSAITAKIGGKNLKSPHPIKQVAMRLACRHFNDTFMNPNDDE